MSYWGFVAAAVCVAGCGGRVGEQQELVDPASSGDASAAHSSSSEGTTTPGACNLLGTWHTHSAPWNGLSTDAVITFETDGTLSGMPAFHGRWSVVETRLSIFATTGQDMNCTYEDHWTLTYSADCKTAPLLPIDSGCTGARRFLDWDVTLTRP